MKNKVYWSIFFIVFAAAASGIYYNYQDTRPCVHPIPYRIGTVDSRFTITNAALIADAEAAAAIWNKAAGKTLLTYDPNAALKINLIYDTREANAVLGNEIATQQANGEAMRADIDALQAQFAALQATTHNRATLSVLAASLNAKVANYNASVAALNAVVQQYNQSAGHTFEEGEYVRDFAGERINIFEFIGDTQLERVLAHEFGHAIGLGHNSDPKSIMYAQNESGNLIPTAADLSALKAVCNL